jgi:hypothetical protein
MSEFLSAAFGAAVGFLGSYWLWWLDRRRRRDISRMVVATNLRHWIERSLSQMYDMKNWESSDGNMGANYGTISEFPFENSLEQVASADHRMALKIFRLIRQKNDANEEILHESDVVGGEEAHEMWRGRCAQVWLRALKLYEEISKQIGWSERIVTDKNRAMMQQEFDNFQNRDHGETLAEIIGN